MNKLNQAVGSVIEAFELVVDRSKLRPEIQCSRFERFLDGLAVIALYGFASGEAQVVQVGQPENEQV